MILPTQEKESFCFAYDIEDYTGSRGMYEDIRQYPFPLVRTAEELVSLLDRPGDYLTREFREKYCTYEPERVWEESAVM